MCENLHFLRSPTPFPADQIFPTPSNAKSQFTTDDYQKLVEKFEFFEHLRWNDLTINKKVNPVIDALVVKYDRKVFGKNDGMLQQFKYAQERTKNKDKTNDTV